jgi:hypothetical protein
MIDSALLQHFGAGPLDAVVGHSVAGSRAGGRRPNGLLFCVPLDGSWDSAVPKVGLISSFIVNATGEKRVVG